MANSSTDQKPGRFQLSRSKGKSSQLEWEFGKEPNELFQLRSAADAPANGHSRTAPTREQTLYTLPQLPPHTTPPHTTPPHTTPLPRTTVHQGKSPNPFASPQPNRWRKPAVEGEVLAPEPSPATSAQTRAATTNAAQSIYRKPATDDMAGDGALRTNRTNNGEYQQTTDQSPFSSQYSNPQYINGSHKAEPSGGNGGIAPQRGRKPATARSRLADLFTGEDGMRRVLTTRLAIDDALDRWWTRSELAPLALLRDGLLVLEAGHDLDETQRSFLLRTALRTGRGMVTALHYQLDADRTAFLIKEALLDTKHTFDPKLINYLRVEDEESVEWADYLEHDLAYEATVATGKRSQLAAVALHEMQQPLTNRVMPPAAADSAAVGNRSSFAPSQSTPLPHLLSAVRSATMRAKRGSRVSSTMPPSQLLPLSHRWSLRWLLWGCLMVLLLLSFGWPQLRVTSAMIEIPAGTYLVSDPTSSNPATSGRFQTVTLPAYHIDQREVSNAAYRRCWEQDVCPIPASFDGQTRPGYFVNRSYDTFPVVNVDWGAADIYCTWAGKRLPSLDEWEVAASLAPATGRRFIYPWGDRFDMRLVNGGNANRSDTQSSGTYHPTGSTSSGLMDMAGNVAEWTAMPAASMVDGFVVKGGSFMDNPEQLRNDALVELQRESSLPWLGFRCAADE